MKSNQHEKQLEREREMDRAYDEKPFMYNNDNQKENGEKSWKE